MNNNGRRQVQIEAQKDNLMGKPAVTITLAVDGDEAAEMVERILQAVREFLDERGGR